MTNPPGDSDTPSRPKTSATVSGALSGLPDSGLDPLGKIGTLLGGKYRITGHVKGGGFAEVYQGFNVNLPDQRVIIKFLRDRTLGDRFEKEAQLLCRLDHPNICRVIDFLPEEFALIVPFINGRDCERIIRSSGPLPPHVFLKVATTITEALAFAHARKIAHRDIKPGNIMIDRNGIPYLIDFGIAKQIDVDMTATRTGYVALTPQFAAPERQTGTSDYNPFLSDIYEAGVTLFVLATGELPYLNAAYPSLRDWDRTFQRPMSPSLLKVLQKAAHPIPSERIQTADELAEMLRHVEMTLPPAPRSNTKWIVMGAAALVIIAVGVWRFGPWSNEKSAPETAAGGTVETKVVPTTQTPSTPSQPIDTIAAVVPTPPVMPKVRFDVSPSEGVTCFIDGSSRSIVAEHEVPAGAHRVRIVHADYPMLDRSVRIGTADTVLAYDLAQEFAGRDTMDLRIALNPPSSDYDLEVTLNGSSGTYSSFPVRDIKRLMGRWSIVLRLTARTAGQAGRAIVDSTVTFPYGGGPHIAIAGARGEIDFGSSVWESKRTIPLQVNWSVAPRK